MLPVVRAAWEENVRVRVRVEVAGLLGDMGPAARDAASLLAGELDAFRRHDHDLYGSHSIDADDKLLAACRTVVRITSAQ